MLLSEMVELNYKKSTANQSTLEDIYGVIYRIYCIPENKNYIGQTFSHIFSQSDKNKIRKYGVLNRVKLHYRDRILDELKERPLYKALNTFNPTDFEVYEEIKIYGKDLGRINLIEGEYMIKYNSLYPNGYNMEEVGKKYTKLLIELSKIHSFDIEDFMYEDKTRDKRCKDICIALYFGLKGKKLSSSKMLELLSTIKIESVRVSYINGFRIIVREQGKNDNIRIYFTEGGKEECLNFAKKISNNIQLSESFIGNECFKYQNKLDEVLQIDSIIKKVIGKKYISKEGKCETFVLFFYGFKNSRNQVLFKLSIGGVKQTFEDTYQLAVEFIEKYKAQTKNSDIIYEIPLFESL